MRYRPFVSFFFAFVIGSTASATRVAGNGADAVETKEGVRLLDRVRIPKAKLIDLVGEGIFEAISKELSKHPGYAEATYYPVGAGGLSVPVGMALLGAVTRLNFYRVTHAIPPVGDRGAVILPWKVKGRTRRLAIQYRNSPVVHFDGALFDDMPKEDQLAFFAHEGAIRLYLEDPATPPLRNIESIAAMIQATFGTPDTPAKPLSAAAVARLYCDAEIMVDQYSNFGMVQQRPRSFADTSFLGGAVHFMRSAAGCQAVRLSLVGHKFYDGAEYKTHEWQFYGGVTPVYGPMVLRWTEGHGRFTVEFQPDMVSVQPILTSSRAELAKRRFSFWSKLYLLPEDLKSLGELPSN